MSNSESFNVGKIFWTKMHGCTQWPALLTGTEDGSREKKYVISFIGDNTNALLGKKCLTKFVKEYKKFSNTRKKSRIIKNSKRNI